MFSRDVQLMIGRPIPIFIRILWCFITPNLLLVILKPIFLIYGMLTVYIECQKYLLFIFLMPHLLMVI